MSYYISAISCSRGSIRSLTDLGKNSAIDGTVIERMQDEGFESFIYDDRDLESMALEALNGTIAQFDGDEQEATAFLVGTASTSRTSGSLIDLEERGVKDIYTHCISSLGLCCTSLTKITQNDCAMATFAIEEAIELLEPGHIRKVYLIVANKTDSDFNRISLSRSAVFSDIAASCIINDLPSEWEIRNIITSCQKPENMIFDHKQLRFDLLQFYTYLSDFNIAMCDKIGNLSDFDWIFLDNFGDEMHDILAHVFSINRNQIFRGVRSQVGHAFSADWMLNLKAFQNLHASCRHARIGIISLGISNIGFLEILFDAGKTVRK